jgi:hypothetical protein
MIIISLSLAGSQLRVAHLALSQNDLVHVVKILQCAAASSTSAFALCARRNTGDAPHIERGAEAEDDD